MTAEARFILKCVRDSLVPLWADEAQSGRSQVGSFAESEASLDWDRVFDIAAGNAVVPHVTAALTESDGTVPAAVRERFRAQTRRNAAENLSRVASLQEVLTALNDADVRAIPFKGPVLAETAYGDLSRRTFSDVDVLIAPRERETARAVLAGLGFDRSGPYSQPAIERSTVFAGQVSEYEFHRPLDDARVELRWTFETADIPNFDTLWERRTTATVAGEQVPALAPVDVGLTQTSHLTKHASRRLAWMADVAAASACIADWDGFLATVAERDLQHAVSVALRIAVDAFDAPVPERVWNTGTLPDQRDVAARAIEDWVAAPVDTTTLLDELLFKTRYLPPRESLRTIANTVFVPRHDEYDAKPLPPRLHHLYYCYRPLRLASIYAPLVGRGESSV